MTSPTRETSNRIATIWPVSGRDMYNQTSYGAPYLIACTFEQGGSKRYVDGKGDEFIPKSIFWYEQLDGVSKPNLNDIIILGDYSANPTPTGITGTETVRNSILHDGSLLGGKDDVQVMT